MENTRQTGSRYGCSIVCFGLETSATTATAGMGMAREVVVDVVSRAMHATNGGELYADVMAGHSPSSSPSDNRYYDPARNGYH